MRLKAFAAIGPGASVSVEHEYPEAKRQRLYSQQHDMPERKAVDGGKRRAIQAARNSLGGTPVHRLNECVKALGSA